MFGPSINSGGLNVLEVLTACPDLQYDCFYSSGVICESSDACVRCLHTHFGTQGKSFQQLYWKFYPPNYTFPERPGADNFSTLLYVLPVKLYRVIRNDCRGFNNLVLQMQPHVIPFYGVTSRIRFTFLLFPQVTRNWRYESEPPLKSSPLTCYKQFGTNSIIVLMLVESQRVHI